MVKIFIKWYFNAGMQWKEHENYGFVICLWKLVFKIVFKGFCYTVFFSCTNRIIAMCGDYYIGGRRFSSLSDLIGYYSHVSCLLKGEKLLYPVAPPEASKTWIKYLSKLLLFQFTDWVSSCSVSCDVQEVSVVLYINSGYSVRAKLTTFWKKER